MDAICQLNFQGKSEDREGEFGLVEKGSLATYVI